MSYDLYEDKIRKSKMDGVEQYSNQYSPYCDFVYYESSVTAGLRLAMRVLKPERPSYILAGTHGWHMSIPDFEAMDAPQEGIRYLTLQVDMRGRAFSDGRADCNGWELYDVIDAINYAKKHYAEYIIDDEVVYFEAGSGGGGNGYAILGKFPDYFAAATVLCGISDYQMWYENDKSGEFRDEMDIWIGGAPSQNESAYRSRSGIETAQNLCTPLFIAHGETDIRVPVDHARRYLERGREWGKGHLIEYLELKDVGDMSHWGKATREQLQQIEALSEQNRAKHTTPVSIPKRGELVVAGYIVTKAFTVILDSIDELAVVKYDLERDLIQVEAKCKYKLIRQRG